MIKGFDILRKQFYDVRRSPRPKLRLEMFLNQVDEIIISKYGIADRSDKIPLPLLIWDTHD
jgi:hypothetical protein